MTPGGMTTAGIDGPDVFVGPTPAAKFAEAFGSPGTSICGGVKPGIAPAVPFGCMSMSNEPGGGAARVVPKPAHPDPAAAETTSKNHRLKAGRIDFTGNAVP